MYFRYFYGYHYKQLAFSSFQTFAVFWMLYSLFLVIPRCLNVMRRGFGTFCLFHLPSCSHHLLKCNTQGVPKRRHIQFGCRRITQWKNTTAILFLCKFNRYVFRSFLWDKKKSLCRHQVRLSVCPSVNGLVSVTKMFIGFSQNFQWEFWAKYCRTLGHAVAQLVEALRYEPECRGFDSQWCQRKFSLT